MKELFGQSISNIYMDDEGLYLIFRGFHTATWCYRAEGDCCSSTWFESIDNPENLIDSEIIGIEQKEYTSDRDDSLDYQEVVTQTYGYTLKTNRGHTDIVFRNESNGYYGGTCEYMKEAKVNFSESPDSPILIPYYDGEEHEGVEVKSVFFSKAT